MIMINILNKGIDPAKVKPPSEGSFELILFLYITFFIVIILAGLYHKNKESKRF